MSAAAKLYETLVELRNQIVWFEEDIANVMKSARALMTTDEQAALKADEDAEAAAKRGEP